jgi:prepilin-type N-terminal cleavage/methylation domain-containing protein
MKTCMDDAQSRLRHRVAGLRAFVHASRITHRASRPGFTLIEIVLVLTILALLAAAAVPSVRGYQEEKAAREPIVALAKLAKAARLKAMQDKRPYQIAFTSKGFTATRYLSPYLQLAQLEEFIQRTEIEAQQKEEAGLTEDPEDSEFASAGSAASASGAPAAPAFKEWTETLTLPEGTVYGIQFWHEPEPTPIEGELVRLWVFQPTGIVSPLSVNLNHGGHVSTVTFSALTADIVKETSATE